MRSSQEIAEAVVAWARETVPALVGGYDHIPAESTEPLPDVVVDVAHIELVIDSPKYPFQALQQFWVVDYTCELSFMVENTDTQAAAQELRGYEFLLRSSLMQDGSLGGRVDFISPFFSFDLTPPFVERPDGTRGREMTMQLSVGEPVQEES